MTAHAERRARLYLSAYPTLLRQLDYLIRAAHTTDENVHLLALFGATATLRPQPTSSANLLMLVDDVSTYFNPASPTPPTGVRLLRSLQQSTGPVEGAGSAEGHERCWQLSGVVSDLYGEDLGTGFLRRIARGGVLLYAREGLTVPPALRGLRDAARWREDVAALLKTCRKQVVQEMQDRPVARRGGISPLSTRPALPVLEDDAPTWPRLDDANVAGPA